jgi:hypothetical protein
MEPRRSGASVAEDDDLLPPDTEVTSAMLRGPRAKKRRAILYRIAEALRKQPVVLGVVAFVLYMVIGWVGYVYHVTYHRYFGAFSPHEKMLCRDEGMMLHVQKIMWARAKAEIANIIPDEKKNNYYGISRKHATKEVLDSHASAAEEEKDSRGESSRPHNADPYSSAKAAKMEENAKRLLQHQHSMKNKHADNFSPGVPKTTFAQRKSRVHRQRRKAMKEAESQEGGDSFGIHHHYNYIDVRSVSSDPLLDPLDENGFANDMDPLNPYTRVRVTADLGFYQHSYGTVDVATTSTTNLLGQSIGTYTTGNGFSTLVYYRIWKNANDYIRGLMYQFAQKKRVMDGETPHCVNLKDCAGKKGSSETMPGDRLKSLFFPASLRRYPFTFVRDPLRRFVSGYTEIEYRYDLAAKQGEKLGLPASGTPGSLGGGVDDRGAPILPGAPRPGLGKPGVHYEDTKDGGQAEWFLNKKGQKVKRKQGGGPSQTIKISAGGDRSKGTARDRKNRRKPGSRGIANVFKSERDARAKATEGDNGEGGEQELIDGDMVGIEPPTAHDPQVQQTQLLKVMPLRNPLGSVLRFTEFVDLVLHYDGSRRLFKTYDNNYEMAHIAPQIGSLLAAFMSEALPMRLYRLEDFNNDWKRLAKETAQPRLGQVRDAVKNHTKLWQHPSSADAHRTTLAANELLEGALRITADTIVEDIRSGRLDKQEKEAFLYDRAVPAMDTTGTGDGSGSFRRHHLSITSPGGVAADLNADKALKGFTPRSRAETAALTARAKMGMPHELLRLPHYRTLEVGYLRAICRIYISDYICADYELPYVCRDLHTEVEQLETEWEAAEAARRRKYGGGLSLMHSILPSWVLYSLAEIPCTLLSTSPPTCIAMFVHGDHLYDDPEDHEEL